tara:strand:- start:1310 stop:1486 length:177 start_codon:yes stop_codon:yes gene_type:complete
MSGTKDKSGRYLFTFMLASVWAFAGYEIKEFVDFIFGLLRALIYFSVINLILYYLIDR